MTNMLINTPHSLEYMTIASKPQTSRLGGSDIKALTAGRNGTTSRNRRAARKGKSTKQAPVNPATLPVVGDLVSGTVRGSGVHGVFVLVNGSVQGRVKLTDISTRFISGAEVSELYPVGAEIEDMIVSAVNPDGKLELKLKTRIGDPEVGSIHKAVVKRVEKYGVIMGFPNTLMRCLCSTEEVDDDVEACKPAMAKIQPGHKYTVKVIRVEQSKIWVTMKKSQLGSAADSDYNQAVMEFEDPNFEDVSADAAVVGEKRKIELIDDCEDVVVVPAKAVKATAAPVSTVDALEAVSDAEEDKTRKKSKRQKDAARREKESLTREKEESLLSGDWKRDPQTAEDFERLNLVEGSSSAAVWITYMSFWLKMTEVSKARSTAERALKQASSFALEQEKFNLWIAYLNMEAAFGNQADEIFVRAAQYCDAKAMHHAMPQVWVRAGHMDKAQTAFERTCSKYPESRKAWLNLIEFLFNQDRAVDARAAFAKAIKAIPKRKHIRATVKFAQFEFRNGNPDRGSTVFEQLLQTNVQKTDIWSVYFDETVKAYTPPVAATVDADAVRALFERAVSLKLKAFKMKFFFKRWLDFETKFGSDEGVEAVKARAVAYVESISHQTEE